VDYAVFLKSFFPMNIFATPRVPVPLAGTLPRCPHSIYAPDSGKALTCEACFPLRPAFQRTPVLPKNSGDPLDHNGRLYANAKEPGACPACTSTVHYVLDDRRWECADCCQKFKAPNQKKQHSETEVEVAA
jgi:hypothetical protein